MIANKTALVTFVMICGSFLTAAAADQDLEKALASQYLDKVLNLRHSFRADSQEYDAQGQPVNPAGEGPWSLYGRMVVKKVAIDKDRLRVEGKRAVYRYDGHDCGQGCMPFMEGDQVKVTIRLNGPLSSASDADSVLSRAFAITPAEIVGSVPAYWQDYLAKFTGQTPKDSAQHPDAGGEKVFKVGEDGVIAAKPVFAPVPEFSEAARKQRFQGVVGLNVVVDKAGRISRVSIAKALGMGLDEQAVNMVGTWRFNPATRNGEPVDVAMYVESNFHLYGRP
jgi:TonB family protein